MISMNLDLNTLFLVTIYIEAILGLLLLFAWVQNAQIVAVAWWGFADLLRAGSVLLFGLYGSAPDLISIDLSNALLLTTFAMTWAGARLFDGRPVQPLYLVAGAALWLVASRIPGVFESPDVRMLLSTAIIAAYTWLTAFEFWRGRSEPLISRWPLIFMLFAHGSLFLLRTPLAVMLPWSPANQVFDNVWMTVISFEALLFTISVAFMLLAMAKERTEFRHKTDAMVDPLTGIANRRAFLQEAGERAMRAPAGAQATAVLLMDLDNFKSINDRFGHAIGDRVLQIFCETASSQVRPIDLVGRLGGEEFAAVLCDVGRERAMVLAERVRSSFAQAAVEVDGQPVGATVSIGMVLAQDAPVEIAPLLAQADQALYCAKEAGKNRVEVATLDFTRKRNRDGGAAPDLAGARSAA